MSIGDFIIKEMDKWENMKSINTFQFMIVFIENLFAGFENFFALRIAPHIGWVKNFGGLDRSHWIFYYVLLIFFNWLFFLGKWSFKGSSSTSWVSSANFTIFFIENHLIFSFSTTWIFGVKRFRILLSDFSSFVVHLNSFSLGRIWSFSVGIDFFVLWE